MKHSEFLAAVEETISTAVAECDPRAWNEDHISYTWISRFLEGMRTVAIDDVALPYAIAFDAYKADGPLEENHGDIAFLVRMTFHSEDAIEGVGFLEAKRVSGSGRFDALKWEQLEQQVAMTPHHRLLLYDTQPTVFCGPNVLRSAVARATMLKSFRGVRATATPTPHALAFRHRTRALHRLSLPLSFQIVARYLNGLDLDFSRPLIDATKKGPKGGIRYLVVAHVSQSKLAEPTAGKIEVNAARWKRIEKSATSDVRLAKKNDNENRMGGATAAAT